MNGTEVTALWECYRNGKAYQDSSGLSKKIPLFVKFFEGDQWPAPTENTKNLPRPVINIIKMICRNKKSAILSTPVKLIYQTDNAEVDVTVFNRFSDYIQKELGQDALDEQAIEDGVKKGSFFYHYYWDSEATGKDGIKTGALRAEIIDILSIFFANPCERDEQKQEWILIASREPVKSVRAKCDKDVDADSIKSDEADDKYATVEQKGDELCTVLTRYFRKNGEVYCEKATRTVVVNKPFPLAPDIEAARRELGFDEELEEDAPNNSLPDNHETVDRPRSVGAYLYPIVVGNYEYREKSIYGLGEVEGLIPNQRAINFNLAMMLLNAQEQAWGKYIVTPGALRDQTINNDPAQILTDHTGTGNGIKRMNAPNMPTQPMQLVDAIMSMTRTVTGSSEVMTGEAASASMSGAAIAQLQSQALLPTEELKKHFWLVKEKQGKVLAQFFKLYYAQTQFSYEEQTPEDNAEPEPMRVVETFNSDMYRDVAFDVIVESVGGTKASAAGDIVTLDMLYNKGAISAQSYINAYPKDALSNKKELLEAIKNDSQGVQTQAAQLEAQNKQLQAVIESQQKAVDSVTSLVRENKELKALIAELLAEAKQKIYAGNMATAEAREDATVFAEQILSNRNS